MKKRSIVFVVLCLLLCMIPSVGMLCFPTTVSTENKAMAEAPALLTEDGSLNREFFSDFESYFNDHMALRNQLVYADAVIQTNLFHESNVSGVIDGSDGWLYYSSTLDDYLGRNLLSERELYNLSHNLAIVEERLNAQGIEFVFTIAPNKNTLYGDNMPYYASYAVSPDHNAKLLKPFLEEQGVSYVDLFELFEEQDEILYLLRDSHWNMKGACLAYNALMDALEKKHYDYADIEPTLITNEIGDLNKMLYSLYGEPEANYDYGLPQNYVVTNDASSVEDGWIVTENKGENDTLLMFRDSFANTLIPFLSNEFHTAYYSKSQPNALERYVETTAPSCVVIQKVERNIAEYLSNPPILTPSTTELPLNILIAETDSTVKLEDCMYDVNYYKISGTVDNSRIQQDSDILVDVNGTLYRAYQTAENGYALYLKKSILTATNAAVKVYAVSGDTAVEALSTTITLSE